MALALVTLLPLETVQDMDLGMNMTSKAINQAGQVFRMSLKPALAGGVKLEILEDDPGRPVTATGAPAVPLDPAPWWFDSVRSLSDPQPRCLCPRRRPRQGVVRLSSKKSSDEDVLEQCFARDMPMLCGQALSRESVALALAHDRFLQ
jgi:hypothetical protein